MSTYVNLRSSPERLIWEVGLFTESRLSIHPQHAEIRADFKSAQVALANTHAEYENAKRDVVVARAHRNEQQFQMQNAIRVFALDLLEIAQGNRKSVVYISYFENGYGIYGRKSLAHLIEAAQALSVRLDSETNEAVIAAGAKLREATAIAEAVQQDWEAKTQRVRDLRSTLHTAKLTWRTAYRRVAGELRALHPDEASYVSSFFVRPTSKRSQEEELAESVEENAGGEEDVGGADDDGGTARSQDGSSDGTESDPAAA